MYSSKEPLRTRFDGVQTVASVVTAVCLSMMLIFFTVGATYTVQTVHHLQSVEKIVEVPRLHVEKQVPKNVGSAIFGDA